MNLTNLQNTIYKIILKLECILIGWNYKILIESGEISFRQLKRYVGSVVIVTILWGVIGYNLAKYIEIESIIGKSLMSISLILIILCIERYIILANNKKLFLLLIRLFLAILMAIIGATIFDSIIFRKDLEVIKIKLRTEQARIELPKENTTLTSIIYNNQSKIDSLKNEVNKLNTQIYKKLYIGVSNSVAIEDSNGTIITKHINKNTIANPLIHQVDNLQKQINQLLLNNDKLQQKLLNKEDEIYKEYKGKDIGLLEELTLLFDFIQKSQISMYFYIILFLFLLLLELLVLFATIGDKCDYNMFLSYQLDIKRKILLNNNLIILKNNSKIRNNI